MRQAPLVQGRHSRWRLAEGPGVRCGLGLGLGGLAGLQSDRIRGHGPGPQSYCQAGDDMFVRHVASEQQHLDTHRQATSLLLDKASGKEDHLLDPEAERHAEVFPGTGELKAAGYSDQTESDPLAVLGPKRAGIPANRIPHLLKRQGPETFGSLQRALDTKLAAKRQRAEEKASPSVP
jgi:hypothetical protein